MRYTRLVDITWRVQRALKPQSFIILLVAALLSLSIIQLSNLRPPSRVSAESLTAKVVAANQQINTRRPFTAYLPLPIDCASRPCVSLTFDDGPDETYTTQIIQELQTENVQATFFLVGANVNKYPAIARAVRDGGHDIGNHSMDHKDFSKLPLDDIDKQIQQTNEAIRTATAVSPGMFRPPYGETTAAVRERILLPIISWNVDPKDWSSDMPEQVAERAVDATQPGSIILLHSTHKTSAVSLPKIIAGLRAKGFQIVPVSQLLQFAPDSGGKIFTHR